LSETEKRKECLGNEGEGFGAVLKISLWPESASRGEKPSTGARRLLVHHAGGKRYSSLPKEGCLFRLDCEKKGAPLLRKGGKNEDGQCGEGRNQSEKGNQKKGKERHHCTKIPL